MRFNVTSRGPSRILSTACYGRSYGSGQWHIDRTEDGAFGIRLWASHPTTFGKRSPDWRRASPHSRSHAATSRADGNPPALDLWRTVLVVFKLFKIPLNKWTLPTAALGGIAMLFFILLIMNYNHPFTKEARIYFYTTPIVPIVRGPVVDVPVQPNKPLKKGDVLFRIDPQPYEYALRQKRAALAEAEQNVKQLRAAAVAAQAKTDQEIASRDRAKQSFERYEAGNEGARAAGRALPVLGTTGGEPARNLPCGGSRGRECAGNCRAGATGLSIQYRWREYDGGSVAGRGAAGSVRP